LSKNAVVFLPDSKNIYEIPMTIEKSGAMEIVIDKLKLKNNSPNLKDWQKLINQIYLPIKHQLKVAVVAKYLDNSDTYISVMEAIRAAAWNNQSKVEIKMVDASLYDSPERLDNLNRLLSQFDGVIVPGGFGVRGLEGKIKASQYCLVNKKPYLGLCLGLQVAVIGAARLAGLKQATTFELDDRSRYQVITTMDDQKNKIMTGGTMRLGNYDCHLKKDSLSYSLYGQETIIERHRHRGECNNQYIDQYDSWGIKIAGVNLDRNLVEIIEAREHPFFVASQFHPEFRSRPDRPHPLFDGFIKTLIDQQPSS
jgi:CTP synthase